MLQAVHSHTATALSPRTSLKTSGDLLVGINSGEGVRDAFYCRRCQ